MDGGTVFVIVLVGVVVIVGVLVGLRRMRKDRRRGEELSAWAAGRGWEYAEEDPLLARSLVGRAFEQGRQHRALHVVRGPLGQHVAAVADFQYVTVSSGRDVDVDKIHRLSVATLDLGRVVPALTIEPQRAAGRVLAKVTGADLEVGDPAFDRAFKVTVQDLAVARHLLTPEVRGLAIEHPHTAWSLQGRLLTTWSEGEQTPAQAEAALAFLDQLAGRLPR